MPHLSRLPLLLRSCESLVSTTDNTTGLSVTDLQKKIRAQHQDNSRHRTGLQSTHENGNQSEPASTTANKVDNHTLDEAWELLTKHADIEIRHVNGSSTSTSKHDGKRMNATTERMWRAITGHGVDKDRVRLRQFECLSAIAAQGPSGILQGPLVKLTGHDKHTIPKRTDTLAENGYIVKKPVIVGHQWTSLLILKRFVKDGDQPANERVLHKDHQGNVILGYEDLFDKAVELLKQQPDNLLAVEDLRLALGLPKTSHNRETRSLIRFVNHLVKCGCFRKCSAKPSDSAGGAVQKDIRCIQLLREPTAADRAASRSQPSQLPPTRRKHRRNKPLRPEADDDASENDGTTDDSADDGDDDGDDDANAESDVDKQGRDESEDEAATKPASSASYRRSDWTPEMPLPNLIFTLIDKAGVDGIELERLHEHVAESIRRRSLEKFLTQVVQSSQPMHLRHLSIVKAVASDGEAQYYSYSNFERAVKAGCTSTELLEGIDQAARIVPSGTNVSATFAAEVDRWGFPSVAETSVLANGPIPLGEIPQAYHRPLGDDGKVSEAHSSKPKKRQRSTLTRPAQAATSKPSRPSKPIIRGSVRSETDYPDFQQWCKMTAERIARAEDVRKEQTANKAPHSESGEPHPIKASLDAAQTSGSVDDVSEEIRECRIADIEADLLCRDRAGVYINPPGAHDTKVQDSVKVGRPRKALIAVIKTNALMHLTWFAEKPATCAAHLSSPGVVQSPTSIMMPAHSQNLMRASARPAGETLLVQATSALATPNDDDKNPVTSPAVITTPSAGRPQSAFRRFHEEAAANIEGKLAEDIPLPSVQAAELPTSALNSVAKDDERPETFDKSYVLGYPGEDFYHIGNGRWKKGLRPSKQNRSCTAGATTAPASQPQNTVAQSPLQQPASLTSLSVGTSAEAKEASHAHEEAPARTFSKRYIDAHPGEDFYHVGAGRWRRGLPPRETMNAQQRVTKPTTPLNEAPDSSAGVTYDKNHVLAHREEQFYHVGNGRWKKGTKPANTARGPLKVAVKASTATETPTQQGISPTKPRLPINRDALQALVNEESAPHNRNSVDLMIEVADAEPMHPTTPRTDLADLPTTAAEKLPVKPVGSLHDKESTGPRQCAAIILSIVEQAGGVFPGSKELWGSFSSMWERIYNEAPSKQAFAKSLKGVVESGKLRKATFGFRSKKGTNETQSILRLPDIGSGADAVEKMKKAIIEAYPKPYIPLPVEASEEPTASRGTLQGVGIQQPATMTPEASTNHVNDVDEAETTDEYPTVEGLKVQRTTQGMALVELERAKNRERQRKWQETGKSRKPGKGQEEEFSDDDDAEDRVLGEEEASMHGMFQVESYHHNPMSAVIKRVNGRGRLSRVLKFDEPSPRSKGPGRSIVTLKVPPQQLQLVDGSSLAESERLRRHPSQQFHAPSGTYGTKGQRFSTPPSMHTSSRKRKTVSGSVVLSGGVALQRTAAENVSLGELLSQLDKDQESTTDFSQRKRARSTLR